MAKDPVCGMIIPDDAPLTGKHKGATYQFCSPGCKDRFEREPERFVGTAGGGSSHHG